MRSKEFWLVQKNHANVKLDSSVIERHLSWNQNLQQKQNWNAKSTNLKENSGKVNAVFVIRAAPWDEKPGRCLEYCRSLKNTLEKIEVDVNLEAIWFEFLMKGALATRISLNIKTITCWFVLLVFLYYMWTFFINIEEIPYWSALAQKNIIC